MFTGIIRLRLKCTLTGSTLVLSDVPAELSAGARLGDSVSVNGVCLTITQISGSELHFFVMQETLDRTNLGSGHNLTKRCNVEFALASHDRLDGHLVTGHVDQTATVTSIQELGDGSRTILLDYSQGTTKGQYHPTLKDSIALDGISLTISGVNHETSSVSVSIIPATWEQTIISGWQIGNAVNVEFNNKGTVPEPSQEDQDEQYMRQALRLSEKAMQTAPPNPWVGSVIVKDGQVIGQGYHLRPGTAHAEEAAILDATQRGHSVRDATVYVTLEPCFPPKSATKRRDPCCTRLIKAKVKRVVIALLDPDLRTAGRSVAALTEAGIEVDVGVLQDEVQYSLRGYIHSRRNQLPYGILKIALSADGCYAARNKKQVWITPPAARLHGRYMMRSSQAVVQGGTTAREDFDVLSKRVNSSTFAPQSVYLDRYGRLPPVQVPESDDQRNPVLIVTALPLEKYLERYSDSKNIMMSPEVVTLPETGDGQGLDLRKLMETLYRRGVLSVVFEGGGQIHNSLLDAGLISEVWIYRGDRVLKGINWFDTVSLGGYHLEPMTIPSEYTPTNTEVYSFQPYRLVASENTLAVQAALRDLRQGRPVILMDSSDREDEADLVVGAGQMIPELAEMFRRYGTGIICCPMTEMRAMRLDLPLVTNSNQDAQGTNFTISCDAVGGTTGVSAEDRGRTLNTLANPNTTPDQLSRPGHVFPLVAEYGGLKLRQGHTEGSVALCQLAGLPPVAAIVEMVRDDGQMMRRSDCEKFVDTPQDKPWPRTIIHMDQLSQYLTDRPPQHLHIVASTDLTIQQYGTWKMLCYESGDDYAPHLALIKGNVYASSADPVMVRIHSECFTGDVLGSLHCDCGPQLKSALAMISEQGAGVIIFPSRHEGRSIGLVSKIQAYRLQNHRKVDTFEANRLLQLPEDNRSYHCVNPILDDLGLTRIHLLTENPDKCQTLGDRLVESSPLRCPETCHNASYMKAKSERHASLSMNEEPSDPDATSKIDQFNTTPTPVTKEMKTMRVGIITTHWHRRENNLIIRDIKSYMQGLGISESQFEVIRVPGCGDMVTTISDGVLSRFSIVVCVGFILQGVTDHAQYTSIKVTHGLMERFRRINRPFIDGIFHCRNAQQIQDKTTGEAAKSLAISILLVMAQDSTLRSE